MNTHWPQPSKILQVTYVALAISATLGLFINSSSAAQAAETTELQPAMTTRDRPITDVSGLQNGRELGAFGGSHGRRVNAPRLIRSESLDKIDATGAQTLARKYHVDLVIDLRTPTQVAEKPDVTIPGATNINISMFGSDGDYSDDTVMYHDLVNKGYVDSTHRGPMITAYSRVFKILAKHTSGTVLIHCSHGMDRTGAVIDLLDHMLGVRSTDILHDYLLSNTGLQVTWATPELLQGTFEHDIMKKYGGMHSYLQNTVGVTDGELSALQARFLASERGARHHCHHSVASQ